MMGSQHVLTLSWLEVVFYDYLIFLQHPQSTWGSRQYIDPAPLCHPSPLPYGRQKEESRNEREKTY